MLTPSAGPSSLSTPSEKRLSMPQVRSAFAELSGRTLSFQELRSEAQRIRADQLGHLPSDLDDRTLIEVAIAQHWIEERDDGSFVVAL